MLDSAPGSKGGPVTQDSTTGDETATNPSDSWAAQSDHSPEETLWLLTSLTQGKDGEARDQDLQGVRHDSLARDLKSTVLFNPV